MNVLAGMQYVQQQGQLGREQGKERFTQRHAEQVMSGDPNAYTQVAAVAGPEVADRLQGAGDGQLRRLKGAIDYFEQGLQSGNDALIQARFREISPFLSKLTGQPGPAAWTEEMRPAFEQVKTKIAMAAQGGQEGLPAGWRQFELQAEAAGLKKGSPEYQQAARIALGQEGRASNAGVNFDTYEWNGRKYPSRGNPRDGSLQIWDGTQWQSLGGGLGPSAAPTSPPPGQPPAPTEPQMGADMAEVGRKATEYGYRLKAAGVPQEQIDALQGDYYNALLSGYAQATPGAVIENGQGQTIGSPVNRTPAQVAPPAGIGVSRTAEEEAAAVAAAKGAVELGYLPQTEAIKANAAVDQAGRSEEAKQSAQSRVELAQLLPKVQSEAQRTVALIDRALNHPGREAATGASSKFDPRNFVPGTDATNFRVLLEQLKGGTFLQAFQSLKGGGAITQVEGTKAEQAIARLDQAQSDEEFIVALQDLREVAEGLPASIQAKLAALNQPQSTAQSGAPQPGTVQDGYRFRGGNPADPNSWERL